MLDNMTKKDASAPSGLDVSILRQAVQLIGGRKVRMAASRTAQGLPCAQLLLPCLRLPTGCPRGHLSWQVETEGSGNVTLETIRVIAETGVQARAGGQGLHAVLAALLCARR